MNHIIKTLIIVIVTHLGLFNQTTPARLEKKEETWSQRNYGWIMTILVTILIILVMALFITICFAFTANTEANQYYYHLI